VKLIDKNPDKYLLKIQESLKNKSFTTSEYHVFEKVEGGKLRVIQALPFFPDRIVHHAIMLVCGDFWKRSLIRDTFQSLPGRGTHDTRRRLQKHITDYQPAYYLQLDVKKFYPSIKHWTVEKHALFKFIKCPDTLDLLLEILHSIDGLPIGSFLSQIWGNLAMSVVDWFVKQSLKVRGYFRYCDDLIVFGDSKGILHKQRKIICDKVGELDLEIKPDWKLHSLQDNSLDFCGYKYKLDGTRLRARIKDNFKHAVDENATESIASYWGWIKPLHDRHLWEYAKEIL
jgi:hypothetical protein